MHFNLVDRVLQQSPDRVVTIKQVSASEEYLQDHFPSFPVLPGVFMVESLVQAARVLLSHRPECANNRYVLGAVRALKYGSFVRPGETLRVEVTLHKTNDDGSFDIRAEGTVLRIDAPNAEPPTAVSGRLTLRPLRLETPAIA
jgi:3-hydroxyacyl-[acyl-carrier-protein] dehydratase